MGDGSGCKVLDTVNRLTVIGLGRIAGRSGCQHVLKDISAAVWPERVRCTGTSGSFRYIAMS